MLRSIINCVRVALCALSVAGLLSACAPAGDSTAGTVRVVASTTILADLARHVAGDAANVDSIAPAGATVEDFAPRPEDSRKVADARLIVVNGLGLDRWMEPLLRNKAASAQVVTLTDGLPAIAVDGSPNPHFWFDVAFAKQHVERIRDGLVAVDSARAQRYRDNTDRYLRDLDALDRELKQKVATLPADRRKLVTSHDAFPYFAKAYGFEIVGFLAPEPGKEPSAAELAELVEKVKGAQVPAIFVERGASPAVARALAQDAGVKQIVSDLPVDSLGPAPADSYVGLMRTVVGTIVDALK